MSHEIQHDERLQPLAKDESETVTGGRTGAGFYQPPATEPVITLPTPCFPCPIALY